MGKQRFCNCCLICSPGYKANYRHIAGEVSPWAATHLERPATGDATPVPGLWTRQQAADMGRVAAPQQSVLWGCDIEEEQPDQLITQMALLNLADDNIHTMQEIVSHGYVRRLAPEPLRLAKSEHPKNDAQIGGISLWESTLDTLKVEALVSEDKVIRVRAAMERLGYRPNELARGLKAQRSEAIGMIVPNLSDPFTANAVHVVQEVARANGYVVILASSGGDVEVERSEIISLVGRQIDGLIVAPADSRKDSCSDIVPNGVHVVAFDQLVRRTEHDSVTVTNRRSAREATEHLASHGCRKIVAIGARPHLYTCQERVVGYRAAIKAASLQPRVCLVEHESLLTAEWLKENVFGMQDADAIFTLNWVCTMLTLRGLRKLGKKAGRHIPMISFDDFELADMLTPSLSAVQQPAEMFGRKSAMLLFD